MKVKDIVAALEEFAPLGYQAPKDNSGLQIGSPDQEVTGVLIGFDCTAALVGEARRRSCNLIITHHPLFYHPLYGLDPSDPAAAAVMAAVKDGIAVYSSHTCADRTPGGVSYVMASRLGLKNVRTLCPDAEGVGFGAVGDLPEAMDAASAIAFVKKTFGIPVVRTSALVDVPVKTIAMCGGSGTSLIGEAIASGAQLYLCGDIGYHFFFMPKGFMVADVGHFESEVAIVDVFSSVIRKKFPNFVPLISGDISHSNPVNYL